MTDLVILSPDERDFWHADFYFGAADWTDDDWNACPAPDGFCTAPTRDEVEARARTAWPEAIVREAHDDD